MDNQHKHIKGYRDLSPEDIALMNEAKELQAQIMQFHAKLSIKLGMDQSSKIANAKIDADGSGMTDVFAVKELERFVAAEPLRWLAIAKTDIQTGFMALVRAIAQPSI